MALPKRNTYLLANVHPVYSWIGSLAFLKSDQQEDDASCKLTIATSCSSEQTNEEFRIIEKECVSAIAWHGSIYATRIKTNDSTDTCESTICSSQEQHTEQHTNHMSCPSASSTLESIVSRDDDDNIGDSVTLASSDSYNDLLQSHSDAKLFRDLAGFEEELGRAISEFNNLSGGNIPVVTGLLHVQESGCFPTITQDSETRKSATSSDRTAIATKNSETPTLANLDKIAIATNDSEIYTPATSETITIATQDSETRKSAASSDRIAIATKDSETPTPANFDKIAIAAKVSAVRTPATLDKIVIPTQDSKSRTPPSSSNRTAIAAKGSERQTPATSDNLLDDLLQVMMDALPLTTQNVVVSLYAFGLSICLFGPVDVGIAIWVAGLIQYQCNENVGKFVHEVMNAMCEHGATQLQARLRALVEANQILQMRLDDETECKNEAFELAEERKRVLIHCLKLMQSRELRPDAQMVTESILSQAFATEYQAAKKLKSTQENIPKVNTEDGTSIAEDVQKNSLQTKEEWENHEKCHNKQSTHLRRIKVFLMKHYGAENAAEKYGISILSNQ